MRCPKCNKIFPDDFNFCPECRVRLNKEESQETLSFSQFSRSFQYQNNNKRGMDDASGFAFTAPKESQDQLQTKRGESVKSSLEIIKNKAIWKIEQGDVAYHVSENEFSSLDGIAGLIIPDGVTAVIYINGRRMASLNGGVYDFVSQSEVDNILNQRVDSWKSLYGAGRKICRNVMRLICGKKVEDNVSQGKSNDFQSMDEIINHLNENLGVSIYLKIDSPFPLLYGSETDVQGKCQFKPILVKTKYLDVEFGLSITFQITDFDEFIRYYMIGRKHVSKLDIQNVLNNFIPFILQAELRNEEIDGRGISEEARQRITARLNALGGQLYGIKIVNIGEITYESADLNRFRQVAKELYCSEKELDFLHRTNEFKNRLAREENDQRVKEARTDLELIKALEEINRDGLLEKEEEEKFVMLLNSQRRIREARNDMEVSQALNEIEKSKLLNQDEMDALVQSVNFKKYDRENIDQMMRQQSLAALAKKNLDLQAEVLGVKITREADVADVKFEVEKRQLANIGEKMDIMEVLYGKQYLNQKRRLEEEINLKRIIRSGEREAALDEKDLEFELTAKGIHARRLTDDYEREIRAKDVAFEDERRKKLNDEEQAKEQNDWEMLRKEQALAMEMLRQMSEMDEWGKDKQHEREATDEERRHKHGMEKNRELHSYDLEKERMATQERMHADKVWSEKYQNMSAEQIAAAQLSKLNEVGSDAAKVLFSNTKELEALKQAQEKIDAERMYNERLREQERMRTEQSREQERIRGEQNLKDMLGQVLGFSTHAIDNGNANYNANFDRLERVATHRMDELEGNKNRQIQEQVNLKNEYHQQALHAQQRQDLHQDQALNYTTQANIGSPKVHGTTAGKPQPTYFIESFGNVPFQLEQVKGLIMSGSVKGDSIITVEGRKYYAKDLAEFKSYFVNDSVIVCPRCGKEVPTGHSFCPYCNADF